MNAHNNIPFASILNTTFPHTIDKIIGKWKFMKNEKSHSNNKFYPAGTDRWPTTANPDFYFSISHLHVERNRNQGMWLSSASHWWTPIWKLLCTFPPKFFILRRSQSPNSWGLLRHRLYCSWQSCTAGVYRWPHNNHRTWMPGEKILYLQREYQKKLNCTSTVGNGIVPCW